MKIEIRQARPDEAEVLTDLSIRSKRSNGYNDAFMEACREELTVTPSRMAEGEYWVAETDVVCGCVCLAESVEGGSGEVHALFIDPDMRRRGVGKLLWLKVVELAKSKGMTKLHLDADPFAVSFYEAMGFVVVGKAPSGSIKGRMIPKMEILLSELG